MFQKYTPEINEILEKINLKNNESLFDILNEYPLMINDIGSRIGICYYLIKNKRD